MYKYTLFCQMHEERAKYGDKLPKRLEDACLLFAQLTHCWKITEKFFDRHCVKITAKLPILDIKCVEY